MNETDYATVETYYNENNLLSNKVEIKEFDENNLTFKKDIHFSWIDTKINKGFIRYYNKKKILLR